LPGKRDQLARLVNRGKGHGLIRFVQKLTKQRHQYPILRRNRFLTGDNNEELGVKDVTWINDMHEKESGRFVIGHHYGVTARSLLLFESLTNIAS
jgi:pullulanase/glycogen debranching enzyme